MAKAGRRSGRGNPRGCFSNLCRRKSLLLKLTAILRRMPMELHPSTQDVDAGSNPAGPMFTGL